MKILCWNVQGLKGKLAVPGIQEYLRGFDLLAMVETWGAPGEEFTLSGFETISKTMNRRGRRGRHPGGITCFYRSELKQNISEVEVDLENTISVRITGIWNFCAVFAYRQPVNSNYHNINFFTDVAGLLERLDTKFPGTDILIMGDLNARIGTENTFHPGRDMSLTDDWRNGERCSKDTIIAGGGEELLDLIGVSDLDILNGKYGKDKEGELTFVSSQGSSVIDLALGSKGIVEHLKDFQIDNRIESNHFPIILLLASNIVETFLNTQYEAGIRKITSYKWNESKKNSFIERLSSQIDNYKSVRDPNIDMARLHKVLKVAGYEMKVGKKRNIKSVESWFDEDCYMKRRAVTKALDVLRIVGTDTARQNYLNGVRQYKSLLNEKKRMWQSKELKRIEIILKEANNKTVWNTINTLRRKPISSCNITPGEWANYFSELLLHDNNQNLNTYTHISSGRNEIRVEELDSRITRDEIDWAIKTTQNRKASGIDGIPAQFIKEFWNTNKVILLSLFNDIFETGIYPKVWSTAILQPIYKHKGDINLPSNYRGISLLPIMSKIFCKIINNRLRYWAENNNIFSAYQAGFRKGMSTLDNVIVLDTLIKRAISIKRGKLYCAFVDFEKAFDSVDREKLWLKLSQLGVSTKIINLLRGMYRDVTFCIRCQESTVTEDLESKIGVRQGCTLSPVLFNLFINDIMDQLMEANVSKPTIAGKDLPGLLYADDLVICSKSVNGLQDALNRLEIYCRKNSLKVNVNKTKIIAFKNGTVYAKEEKWSYKGKELEKVKIFTYLGVKFAMNGRWCAQIKAARVKGLTALKEISRMRARIPDIPIKLCDEVFRGVVIPAMSYGAEVWALECASKILEQVETTYYKNALCLAQNVANVGVLKEFGEVGVAVKLQMQSVKYFLKKLEVGESLVTACLLEEVAKDTPLGVAARVKLLFEQTGFGESWANLRSGNVVDANCIESRLKDIAIQNVQATRQLKTSLSLQRLLEDRYIRENYIDTLGYKARSGLAWFRMGGWKIRKFKTETGEVTCVFCGDTEDWTHILMNCCATERWRLKWWGVGKFHGDAERNEILGIKILTDTRVEFREALGNFIWKVRGLRESELKTK